MAKRDAMSVAVPMDEVAGSDEEKAYWDEFVTDGQMRVDLEDDAHSEDAFFSVLQGLGRQEIRLVKPSRPVSCLLRRTRRGRLRKEVSEVYCQDFYPCGVVGCEACGNDALTREALGSLSPDRDLVVIDATVASSEVDYLWDDNSINNCVILQSVLDQVRASSRRAYNRLLRLCGIDIPAGIRTSRRLKSRIDSQEEVSPDRRFYLFPNAHFRDTFVEETLGGGNYSSEKHAISQIVLAATWYARHVNLEDDRPIAPYKTTILTSSADRKLALERCLAAGGPAAAQRVSVSTIKEWIEAARVCDPTAGEKLTYTALQSPDATSSAMDLPQDFPSTGDLPVVKRSEIQSPHAESKYNRYLEGCMLASRIRAGEVMEGVIKMSPSTCWKGIVVVHHRGGSRSSAPLEIKISGNRNMNRAIHGDKVFVRLLDLDKDKEAVRVVVDEETRMDGDPEAAVAPESVDTLTSAPTGLFGEVVAIAKRNWRTYCGSLRPLPENARNSEERFFIPANPQIPPIIVKTLMGARLDGRRLLVTIDAWDRFSWYPRGHWTDDLGKAGSTKTEGMVILREHEVITREFPPSVMACLPDDSYEIPLGEIRRRLDLRLEYCFCDQCRLTRKGRPVPGRAEFPSLVGTPCLYTKKACEHEESENESQASSSDGDEKVGASDSTSAMLLTEPPLAHWSDEKHHHGSSNKYSKVAQARLKKPEWEEYEIRDDETAGTICCSIDPPTCVDIDDALSLKFLRNGNFEVGVHIADVSHYVRPETALDREAAERSTTVYLVDSRTDMLPKLLSAGLCSIKSGVDRLTFSCFWEMSKDAKILKTTFAKTIMHSVAAFDYGQAQQVMDDPANRSPVAVRLRLLNDLAKKLRKGRMDRGAVELSTTEIRFKLGRHGKPTDVAVSEHLDTHSLVEEFMLLANMSVAERIVSVYPDCSVLRRHPPPKGESLAALAKVLATKGIELKYGSNAELAASLDRCVLEGDPAFNKLVRATAVQCMNQAIYFCTGDIKDEERRRHYALATDLYTHFTSPIRRYADILVHRLLAASLNLDSLPLSLSQTSAMIKLCERITDRHRNAQFCSRDSAAFFAYKIFSRRGELEVDAVVTQVRRNGCVVQVAQWGVDGQARVDQDKYRYEAESQTLVGVSGAETISVFDHVLVKIKATSEDFRVTYDIIKKLSGSPTKAKPSRKRTSRSRSKNRGTATDA